LLIGSAHTPDALFGPFQMQRRVALPARPGAHVDVTASSPASTTCEASKKKPGTTLFVHVAPVVQN